MMKTILITEGDQQLHQAICELMPGATIQLQPGLLNTSEVFSANDIEALCVTVRSPVGANEMQALPNLKIILTGSAGYDHIDIDRASSRGISVCNVPQYGPAVAEFNIALLLSLSRNLHIAHLNTLQRDFSREGLLGQNLAGKTLGVIGTGNIGAQVVKLAATFGMKVIASDPQPNPDLKVSYVLLADLLRESNFIAVCCPLNQSTRHLIGKHEFDQMKKGVMIVNTSRGAVIDTHALLWAVDSGIVAGAALDVLEGEARLPNETLYHSLGGNLDAEEVNSIAEDLSLIRHPRVLVTPHMAYFTEDSLAEIRSNIAKALADFAAGRPVDTVPPAVGQHSDTSAR